MEVIQEVQINAHTQRTRACPSQPIVSAVEEWKTPLARTPFSVFTSYPIGQIAKETTCTPRPRKKASTVLDGKHSKHKFTFIQKCTKNSAPITDQSPNRNIKNQLTLPQRDLYHSHYCHPVSLTLSNPSEASRRR